MNSMKTLKLLFLDPSRFEKSAPFVSKIEEYGIVIVFECGAHPAYIIDTGIEIEVED